MTAQVQDQKTQAAEKCRCGADASANPHPCHGEAYSCRKPARQRFYGARPVGLAGAQLKLGVSQTWACDACWRVFERQLEAAR